ncbi:hypothetical protein [Streptomyces abikoensis]|uniref:hypothetical protein n=1 Tax=Streptomyces abikoensis TaxID=97398 RepID=UPI00167ADEA4|nr:hypothetical protein [Streptomyces abikoensis]GGP55988.1 hypothetical protein GCM10010214_31480 [Streptomyces abikoensis]
MKMKYEQPAPSGATFAADAFDGEIGKEVPVNIPGEPPTTGRILAAHVADDGRSVELTLDVDVQIQPYMPGSFGLD